ncbi:MAG TPA: MBL fold metallo-hydrolase [Armatimonadota bacterium]|nr:MBL fold metallo-hydrolase [Armatimonadota bacterium]
MAAETKWIDLGGLEFCVVSGGRFKLDGGSVFGIIPRALWERHDPPDERNRMALDANCVVVRTAGQTLVIDTGVGDKLDAADSDIFGLEPGASIRAGLEGIGITTDRVDVVLLSHLHMDHAGGASELGPDGLPRPTFPNARCVAQRGEWEDARANRSTMRASYLPENLQPLAESGRLDLLNGSGQVLPGVYVEVAPGHTPHHQIVHLIGQNGRAIYTGDLLPTWSHTRGPYNTAFDQNPYENMQRKLKLLQDACENDWLLLTAHDVRTPIGPVEEDGRGGWRLKV